MKINLYQDYDFLLFLFLLSLASITLLKLALFTLILRSLMLSVILKPFLFYLPKIEQLILKNHNLSMIFMKRL